MSIRREQNESKRQQLLQNLEIGAGLYSNGETILRCDRNCINTYRWLKQNRAELEKQPRLAGYLNNRPKTPV
ncbi:unnamed protein product [Adineta steineri]|uniref:Uncharacterized protein n=1 Tax=Adineta steineri TaxID=433720 RepID=A0A820FWE6_9BILA|nr:unnamed protein product [Adineta steineri]